METFIKAVGDGGTFFGGQVEDLLKQGLGGLCHDALGHARNIPTG
jgi:hypothetical protein